MGTTVSLIRGCYRPDEFDPVMTTVKLFDAPI